MRLILFLALVASAAVLPPVQGQPETPAPVESAIGLNPDTIKTLRTLHDSYQSILDQLAGQRRRLPQEKDAGSRAAIEQQIQDLEKRRGEIERDFTQIASGVSENDFNAMTETVVAPSLKEEFTALLTPLVSDMREITKRPRAIETLQQQIATQNVRSDQADAALLRLEQLITAIKSSGGDDAGAIIKMLQEGQKVWQSRKEDAANRTQVLRYQLQELRKSGADFWGQLAIQARNAVLVRGLNILLAMAVFFIVMTAVRAAYFYTMKYVPLRQYQRLGFMARLLDVLHQGVSVLLATAAALLVLYARGDWLLGSLAVLALIGLALAAKSGITKYLEQVRLLLNLGTVREGERVLIKGVPWKVGRINLFTQLTNPEVGGQGLRLPMEQLMGMTSRTPFKDETWFPCKKGDWILLNNADQARVLGIGPDYVELDMRGGQRRWIATEDFVKLDVASLENGFAVSTTFGLDCRHQAEATTSIPAKLAREIEEGLLAEIPREHLRKVIVEFKSAGASSLDYLIVALFEGAQAANYFTLGRALQRLAVACCNRHGWSIPFPQMVLLQPEAPQAPPAGKS